MRLPSDWLATVHHDGSPAYVEPAAPRVGGAVRLRLRVGVGAPVRRVFVRTCEQGWQVFTPMAPASAAPPAQWFEATLPVRRAVTRYRFVLECDDGVRTYTANGATPYAPPEPGDFRLVADEAQPPWLAGAVAYQVFVDRFANGDPSRDPRPEDYDAEGYAFREHEYAGARPRTFAWGAPPDPAQPFGVTFYGGDLDGIVQRLEHLQALGVDLLSLTPIFTSGSCHRYDTADHAHVDPRVGGDAGLARLREALSARGMRYLLDLDLRHVGAAHPWFRAAQADPGAPEARFFLREHGDFARWLGLGAQRVLDLADPELQRRLVTGEDAVLGRWLRPPFGADGWTLHFPQGSGRPEGAVDPGRLARRAARAARPDACLASRSLVEASARFQGDELDALADFSAFLFPLCHWLRGYQEHERDVGGVAGGPWSTAALEAAWRAARAALPWSSVRHALLLLGCHDLPRIRTLVGGSDALHRLAAVIQFTYPGIPAIYYGDEIGLEDDAALGPRGCMPWDPARWNGDLLAFYRRLVALRRASEPLCEGGFQVLAVEPDTLVYQREGRAGRALVVAHRGERPRPARLTPVDQGGIPRRHLLRRALQWAAGRRPRGGAAPPRAAAGRHRLDRGGGARPRPAAAGAGAARARGRRPGRAPLPGLRAAGRLAARGARHAAARPRRGSPVGVPVVRRPLEPRVTGGARPPAPEADPPGPAVR